MYEEAGKLIGQRVLPLDGLQAGYRHISLRTEGNFPLSLPTLFCRIILKTYVPDGLSDFVDALNNPKEHQSKEEKRLKQLREKMGIDEKDIIDVPACEKKAAGNAAGDGSKKTASAGSELNSKKEFKIEKITRETLKSTKGFQKLLKKQTKEKENLKKKQNKERALMQKQHSAIIDKLNASIEKASSNSALLPNGDSAQGCSGHVGEAEKLLNSKVSSNYFL